MQKRYTRQETPMHRFVVGQKVRMRNWVGSAMKSTAIFQILATLPASGGSLQYRIRDNDEKHERITTEDNLEAADMWSSKDRLSFTK